MGTTHLSLPVVILGRGGGKLASGRTLDYLGKPNRKMCSLFLSLMDKFGVRLPEFGDSRERAHGGLKPPESSRGLSHASFLRHLAGKTESVFREETFCARPAAV